MQHLSRESYLIELYQPIILVLAHKLFSKYGGNKHNCLLFGSLSKDDLEQCGRIACLSAIRSFDENRQTKLSTYIHVVVFREIRRAILNSAKQYQHTINDSCNNSVAYPDNDIWEWVPSNLDSKEQLVLEMRLAGYTLKEIGVELSVSHERARVILEEVFEKMRIASA